MHTLDERLQQRPKHVFDRSLRNGAWVISVDALTYSNGLQRSVSSLPLISTLPKSKVTVRDLSGNRISVFETSRSLGEMSFPSKPLAEGGPKSSTAHAPEIEGPVTMEGGVRWLRMGDEMAKRLKPLEPWEREARISFIESFFQ